MLAKAPLPGYAKSRLIPALGAEGAAKLQRAFTKNAVGTAIAANLGPVTLWCTPHPQHRLFRALRRLHGIQTFVQASGDLGARMHLAFRLHCATGPLLLTGTDCPALRPNHLRLAAAALLAGNDAVFVPAEDGGYALVGLRQPQPALFMGMTWSTESVMEVTLQRSASLGLKVHLLEPLWDVDAPADLERLERLSFLGPGCRQDAHWSDVLARIGRRTHGQRSTEACVCAPAARAQAVSERER